MWKKNVLNGLKFLINTVYWVGLLYDSELKPALVIQTPHRSSADLTCFIKLLGWLNMATVYFELLSKILDSLYELHFVLFNSQCDAYEWVFII